MKLSELAAATGATFDPQDSDVEISGAAGLDEATISQVTFLANPRYTPRLKTTSARAIFVGESVEVEDTRLVILRTKDPYLAYTRALRLFHHEPTVPHSVHPSAVIDPEAIVAPDVSIGPFTHVGPRTRILSGARLYANVTIYEDATIGQDSIIHSGAVIRERTVIGERVIVHNNAVIGCDGFGYAKDEDRHWLKIPQTGRVVIEDDVEIGAGSTIDRASVGESRIGRGSKIDNLVQVGHSCTIGEDTLLCAQVGLAGSSHIGDRVILAGQAGVAGHLTIGNDVVLTAKSATSHNVPDGKVISGIPAFDNKDWLRSTAAFRRLGEMQRTIRELERKVAELQKRET